jgi:ligand-binding sensor domain-containing protein
VIGHRIQWLINPQGGKPVIGLKQPNEIGHTCKRHGKSIVLTLLLLLSTGGLPGNQQDKQVQEIEINFERISIEDGLSQSSVFCILQDSRGFMWFGTQHGLNRYDGHTFKLYERDPRIINSLSHGFVQSICEDKQGMLWIGTLGGGLNKFDRDTEKFTIYKNGPGDDTSLSDDNVWSIHEDRSGILWIGTDNGLNRYNRETNNFRNYKKEPKDSLQNRVRIIYEDRAGVLWVGTDDGLLEYNRERNIFILYQNKPGEDSNHNKVRAISEDEPGILWIGTEGGLQKFDGEKRNFINHQVITNNFTALEDKPISTLYYENQSGILWIGTRREGLYRLNKKEKEITPYISSSDDPNSLSHNDVRVIYTDRSGLIWIGTDGGGINKFDPKGKKFVLYVNNPLDPISLNNNDIMAICNGNGRMVWIGTRGGGVNKFDLKNSQFTHYEIGADVNDKPGRNSIQAVWEDRTGRLWVGTERAGLYWFDKKMKKCNLFKKGPISSEENILDIYVDEDNVLWIGSLDGGLIKFEEDREKYKNYKNTPGDPNTLSNNKVYSIYKDRSGIFWIGTAGGGLNKFDKEKEKFQCYRPIIGNTESLSHDFIFTIYEDKKNTLWIGTNGGGLNKFDREKETFTAYTMKDGLPNNVIYAILDDDDGNLWISTNKGLSKFNPETNEFRNYTIRDGLQGYEFNREVACISNGEMFFGGITGLNSFYPVKLEVKSSAPPIVITSFKRWNKDAKLDKSITENKKIELSYKDDFISFEFAALSFTDPEMNQYAYKLEPVNEDWIRLGNKHDIDFPNLEPGQYTFRVKGSNSDGVWNEEGTSIKIIVNPPFWKTWWFRVLFVLFIAGAIFVFVRRRIRNIEKANILLKKEMTALKDGLFTDNLKNPENFSEIITQSKQMHAIFHTIETIEKSNLPVLITGETGTGKELIARAIHKVSRREGNFVEKKVGGLDDTEFRTELLSLMKQAENGTLFLDEIGDISPHSQVALLRLIKLREYSPQGKQTQQSTNVRIITATNRDLKAMIESGEFRRDLYFRLKIHEIDLPPLRERKEDIHLLVDHFLDLSARKLNKKVPDVPVELLPILESYDFPGNITELGGMVYNAMTTHQDGILSLVDIFQQIIRQQAGKTKKYSNLLILYQRLKNWKKHLIKKNHK